MANKVTAARCHCGRLQSQAEVKIQHTTDRRISFYRCACGFEWTVVEQAPDMRDAVTSEEVIQVHERMKTWEGPFSDLLG